MFRNKEEFCYEYALDSTAIAYINGQIDQIMRIESNHIAPDPEYLVIDGWKYEVYFMDQELPIRNILIENTAIFNDTGVLKNKIFIGKKINQICKKKGVKFLVNDDPMLSKKLNADGCHLGQKDIKINEARKIIGNKIIGKIKSITDFGIFVELDGEIDGLIHISDISWNDEDNIDLLLEYSVVY